MQNPRCQDVMAHSVIKGFLAGSWFGFLAAFQFPEQDQIKIKSQQGPLPQNAAFLNRTLAKPLPSLSYALRSSSAHGLAFGIFLGTFFSVKCASSRFLSTAKRQNPIYYEATSTGIAGFVSGGSITALILFGEKHKYLSIKASDAKLSSSLPKGAARMAGSLAGTPWTRGNVTSQVFAVACLCGTVAGFMGLAMGGRSR
eukprot:UC4_evm3s744